VLWNDILVFFSHLRAQSSFLMAPIFSATSFDPPSYLLELKVQLNDFFIHSFAFLPAFFLEFNFCFGTFSPLLPQLGPELQSSVWPLWDYPHFFV
jgi:hypothetical protein